MATMLVPESMGWIFDHLEGGPVVTGRDRFLSPCTSMAELFPTVYQLSFDWHFIVILKGKNEYLNTALSRLKKGVAGIVTR